MVIALDLAPQLIDGLFDIVAGCPTVTTPQLGNDFLVGIHPSEITC
jgi:hypothetical protein